MQKSVLKCKELLQDNRQLEEVMRSMITSLSPSKEDPPCLSQESILDVISTSKEVDVDTLMAQLYFVLVNFIVCFINLVTSHRLGSETPAKEQS